jgi:hypothetical protein
MASNDATSLPHVNFCGPDGIGLGCGASVSHDDDVHAPVKARPKLADPGEAKIANRALQRILDVMEERVSQLAIRLGAEGGHAHLPRRCVRPAGA